MSLSLPVFYCFPRSGGTLLNQCLLCSKSTVVLSEVNPAGSFLAIERQAGEWFGLITEKEVGQLGARTYLEKIALVARRCRDRQQQLCIRDWVAINFIPKLTPLAPACSGTLEQRAYLRAAGYDLREIVLLRRSGEVLHSLRKHMPGFTDYPLDRFAGQYRAFLRAVEGCPKFYLEEFTRDPDAVLRRICAALSLEFPPGFATEFHGQTHVTGNTTLQKPPPSATSARITSLPRSARPRERLPAGSRDVLAALDALAGYPPEARE